MKKTVSIVLAFVLCAAAISAFAGYSPAEKEITVTYNGENVDLGGAVAQNIDGCTMVPMRAIFELAGCTVSFDGEKRTILAEKEDYKLLLTLDSKEAALEKNGKTEKKQLDIAPCIVSERTLVPVRFISESLGFTVNWNPSYKEVVIIDFDRWEERLSGSFFGKLMTEEIKSGKIYGGSAYISADEKLYEQIGISGLKKAKYNCQAVLDSNFDLYLKSELISEIAVNFIDAKTVKTLSDKYVKLPIKQLLMTELGIQLESTGSLWKSLKTALLNDEFIYSTTVKDIDNVISTVESIKISENSKFLGSRPQNVPSSSRWVDITDILVSK